MTLPICDELREFEGSDALSNGDFTLMDRSADLIETLVEVLEAAALKFHDYQRMHEEKAHGAGLHWPKADPNRIFAEQCEAALALARGENTPGSEEMK